MDFSLTDEQQAFVDVARRLFDEGRELRPEAGTADRRLWQNLAGANLLGIAVPETHGGNGFGLLELCLVFEQQGQCAVAAPLLATLVMGALPVARFGTPAQQARLLPGVVTGAVRLSAALPGQVVPDAAGAESIVVGDDRGLLLADPEHLDLQAQVSTTGEVVHTLVGRPDGDLLTDDPAALRWVELCTTVGLCALQVGLADGAVAMTAAYTTGRHQFGRPIATFQAVQQRIADAYIDVQCMRSTMLLAAWRLSSGLAADEAVAVAKFWAAEGGHRVVQAAQHLHGGVGVDLAYPLHRYTLWSKMIELTLGGANEQLAGLGRRLAAHYAAGATSP